MTARLRFSRHTTAVRRSGENARHRTWPEPKHITPGELPQALARALGTPNHATELGCLYAADCLDVLAALPTESIDLVVTSPPYDRQAKYRDGERYQRTWYETTFLDITREILRVLRPTGQFVLNYRSKKEGVERSLLQYEIVGWLRDQGFLFVEDHVWVKPSPRRAGTSRP